jgi:hypothetical protein
MIRGIIMPILKCGVTGCAYFYDEKCSKSVIKVSGSDALRELDTSCVSFQLRNREASDNYNLEIGTIDDIISENVSVNCEAKTCIYNRNYLCYAIEIKIDGTRAREKHETFCHSFVNR